MESAFIIGCGYTGRRVAARLLTRGIGVTATTRASLARTMSSPRKGAVRCDLALYSIPPVEPVDITGEILARLSGLKRVVYLSATSVYGAQRDVDESTPAAPNDERGRARLEAEHAAAGESWSSLILRPAAIYGPGRGIHESLCAGTHRLGADRWVSRIHVDDLAAICEAALLSSVEGAFPVADEEPCRAHEIAAYCAKLLGVPMPAVDERGGRRADRRVDGRAVLRELGVTLRYPSYRVGIPALLRE